MGSGFPEIVESFVRTHVRSVEQLEVLLLLRRAQNETWTPETMARELRIDVASARRRLEDLRRAGFARDGDFHGRFVYALGSAERERALDLVAQAWTDRRASLITLIFGAT